MGLFGLAAAAMLVFLKAYAFAGVAAAASLLALVWGIFEKISMKKQYKLLLRVYHIETMPPHIATILSVDTTYNGRNFPYSLAQKHVVSEPLISDRYFSTYAQYLH